MSKPAPRLPELCDWLGQHIGADVVDISPEHRLVADLRLDSLALYELALALEDEFGVVVPEPAWTTEMTVSGLYQHFVSLQ